jgi:putative membrane protein
MHGINGMGWGMGIGWIIGPLVLIAIIWLVYKMSSQNNNNNQRIDKSALDILKERYAAGEINKAEFEEKKKVLSNATQPQ